MSVSAHLRLQLLGHLAQQVVAGRVAVAVVDVLEAVEVEDDERERAVVALGARQLEVSAESNARRLAAPVSGSVAAWLASSAIVRGDAVDPSARRGELGAAVDRRTARGADVAQWATRSPARAAGGSDLAADQAADAARASARTRRGRSTPPRRARGGAAASHGGVGQRDDDRAARAADRSSERGSERSPSPAPAAVAVRSERTSRARAPLAAAIAAHLALARRPAAAPLDRRSTSRATVAACSTQRSALRTREPTASSQQPRPRRDRAGERDRQPACAWPGARADDAGRSSLGAVAVSRPGSRVDE